MYDIKTMPKIKSKQENKSLPFNFLVPLSMHFLSLSSLHVVKKQNSVLFLKYLARMQQCSVRDRKEGEHFY